jgi:hypothetical protein
MRLKTCCCALVLTALTAATGVAKADQVTFMASVPLGPTNYNSSVSVSKFDPALGILNKVTFMLTGHVEGSAAFESLDAEPALVEMELAAEITLQRPDLSTLVVALPLVATSDNASAFDGLIDFGGASGKSYAGLANTVSEMSMSMNPLDLLLFTGPAGMPGNITLPVVAEGASTGSGAGNLLLQFATSASADVKVTYEYTVPEPATAGLTGLLGVGLLRRRRA